MVTTTNIRLAIKIPDYHEEVWRKADVIVTIDTTRSERTYFIWVKTRFGYRNIGYTPRDVDVQEWADGKISERLYERQQSIKILLDKIDILREEVVAYDKFLEKTITWEEYCQDRRVARKMAWNGLKVTILNPDGSVFRVLERRKE